MVSNEYAAAGVSDHQLQEQPDAAGESTAKTVGRRRTAVSRGGKLARHVGESIRDHRIALLMSQRELAERSGIDTAAICRFENAVYVPNLDQLEWIAQVLEVSPVELLNGFKGTT